MSVPSGFEDDAPLSADAFDCGPHTPVIAVAVSGGPDSMALLWLLSQRARASGAVVHALTVDHGLRAEAAAEAAQVGAWVEGWPGVRHEILKLENNIGDARVMERAREGRYDALLRYCREHNIEKLFTAHHRDDQAETFLFRLAKGSGLDGLASMRRDSVKGNVKIVRPLLDVMKSRLIATCRAHDIPFVDDPTNDDARFARPRLRRSQAVLAEEGLSAKRLAVTAARLARARDALDHYAAASFATHVKEQDAQKIIFDHAGLSAEPAETQLRVIARAVEQLAPNSAYGPRMEKLEEIAAALCGSAPFRRQTLGGCIFSRAGAKIVIEREWASE